MLCPAHIVHLGSDGCLLEARAGDMEIPSPRFYVHAEHGFAMTRGSEPAPAKAGVRGSN
jgi:hypothetical protein